MLTVPDEVLEHQIKDQLMHSDEVSSQSIEVGVNEGEVTLAGQVQSFRRKLAAEEIVESCSAVKSVINELEVTPSEAVNDLDIASNVNHAIAETKLSGECLRVDVHEGEAILTGYVADDRLKSLANDVATGVAGVRSVKDMLRINNDNVLDNLEHCSVIKAAIGRIDGMELEDIAVTIVDETARLSGVVDADWKKEIAETTTRQFRILNVCNEIVVDV